MLELINEQTWYHSNAVERYAKTSMKQKEKVSDLLNVLPKGVQKVNKENSDEEENVSPKQSTKDSPTNDVLVISNDQNKPVNVDVAVPQNLRYWCIGTTRKYQLSFPQVK